MREKLLFIAPTVPLFDLHSGELRLFTILNILSKSYDITYLPKHRGNITPIENARYVSCLKDLGISVSIESHSIIDILNSNKFKAAFIEFYHVAEHYLPRIKYLQSSCKVIIDTVDVHYLRLHRKYKLTNNIDDLMLVETTKAKELAIYRKADIVLTVTDEDAKILQNDSPNINIRILPNVHHLVYPSGIQNRNEIIFVGGFNHEPNIDAVIYFCEDIFPQIRKVIPSARFTIVGSNPPVRIKALRNDFITVTGYVPSTTPYLQGSYVSVAPLRYGAGMKGKIGEAMAHGLPVVTTSIGAEGMGLTDRENVLIADTPEDFANAVIELMLKDNLYKIIQKNSMEHVRRNFTPERVGSIIENILAELDGLPVRKMSLQNKTRFLFNYALDFVKKTIPFMA